MATRPPDPALWPHVRRYVGWFEHMAAPLCRRELPGDEVPIIIGFGAPVRVFDAGESDRYVDLESFTTGAYDAFVRVVSSGPSGGIQIDVSLLGARLLLAQPLEPLRNRAVGLDDLPGWQPKRLAAQLQDLPSWEARFALLDRVLRARLTARPPSAEVIHTWTRIVDTGGRVSMGRLVDEAGWSHKHLIARFREEIGLAPKTMARVLRFARAANRLRRPAATLATLADVALDCGYYDQSHFTRDFRAFAGVTPGELVAHLLPDGGGIVDRNP